MKKVFSALVAAFVIFCFSGMAFAAEPANTETTTGIVTKKTVAKKKKAAYKKKAKKAKSVQQKNNLPPKTQN